MNAPDPHPNAISRTVEHRPEFMYRGPRGTRVTNDVPEPDEQLIAARSIVTTVEDVLGVHEGGVLIHTGLDEPHTIISTVHATPWTRLSPTTLWNGPICRGCGGYGVAVFHPAPPSESYERTCPACNGHGREPS